MECEQIDVLLRRRIPVAKHDARRSGPGGIEQSADGSAAALELRAIDMDVREISQSHHQRRLRKVSTALEVRCACTKVTETCEPGAPVSISRTASRSRAGFPSMETIASPAAMPA